MSTQSIAIGRAILLLQAAKAKFKIIAEDGEEHGELEVVMPSERRKRQYMKPYYLPFVQDLQMGDVVQIPFGDYEGELLRHALVGYCQKEWGAGAYISTVNSGRRYVEVMRVM